MSSYMECVVSWHKDGGVRDSSFQNEAMPNPDRRPQQEQLCSLWSRYKVRGGVIFKSYL